MKPLRIAVWGLGRHAIGKILPAIRAARGLELHGVCSRSEASVLRCSEALGCRTWTDAAAMLGDAGVDIVYVATPTGLHAEHGRRVLDAGKHLWCEKPMTCRLRDTELLLQSSRRNQRALCEAFMYLHHPQFRQLSAYLAEGRIGAVRSIRCRFGIPRLEHPGFRDDPALGGSALLDVGCYPASAIQALFPEEKLPVSHAEMFTQSGSLVDTDGHALIALSGGGFALLEWGIHRAYCNDIEVWGEKGVLSTDKIFSKPADYVPVFRFRDVHGAETTEVGAANDHFVSMLEHFRSLLDDARALEAERGGIARRAEMLDRMQSVAQARVAAS